jgi:hypothetical protein
MTRTKYLKGECRECHGHIEFPADAAGMSIDCPHCGKPTDLLLVAPPDEPLLPRRTIIWTIVAVVILGLGVAAVLIALNLTQKKMARKKEAAAAKAAAAAVNTPPPAPIPEDPATKLGFRVSTIKLEKTQGSSLTYAVGTLTNTTNRQRFGVKIELDLLDDADQKIGSATDYQSIMEPNSKWQFKALCVDSKAKSAKLAAVKEDQ